MNLNSNLFEDVKLVFTCGKTLLAHRLVLSAASPVLRNLLQTKSLVKSELVHLLLPDFDFTITRQLLKLIYSGEVRLENGQLGLVVEYGRLLDIPAFREDAEKRISEKGPELEKGTDVFLEQSEEPITKETELEVEESEELAQNGVDSKKSQITIENELTGERANEDSNEEKGMAQTEINSLEKVKEENIEGNDLIEDSIETSNKTELLFYKIPQSAEQSKKCPDCDYKSKWMGDLRKHRLAKHEGLRHECEICQAKFTGKPSLRNHKLTKHEGVSFPCKKCEYTTSSIHQLRNHYQSKHEGVRYPCLHCEEKFIHRSSQKKHTMAKHLGVKFNCPHCEEEFPRQDRLSIHIRKCHEEGEYREVRFYPCLQCEDKFKKRSTLKKHTMTKHLGVKFTCQHCEEEFPRQVRLSFHIRKCHEEGKNIGDIYPCLQCEEKFKHRSTLKKHTMAKHLGVKFACKYCGQEFQRQYSLSLHKRKYHEVSKNEQVRYPCPDCKETYRFQNSLKHHTMSEHLGIRYHCEYCAEEFRRQSSLKDHTKRCH